jgi:mycothiol synthase
MNNDHEIEMGPQCSPMALPKGAMMIGCTDRPYADAPDLQAMIGLLIAARPAERIADYPSVVDLREMLGTSEGRANTRLWEGADGPLVGFAIVRATYGSLLFEVAPWAIDSDVVAQMIAWGEERVRSAEPGLDEPIVLRASSRDDNTGRMALLERYGFVRQDEHTLHMVRPLGEPIPEPQGPKGFVIRHVEGEHEVEALVALHRAAFGTQNLTVEARLSWMRTPEYDPALDLVAVAPDGVLAAYVFCSISHEENGLTGRKDGYTDPVATHPAFQRQGLARALLLTGFGLLKRRGMEHARTGTSSSNTAMQWTAKSVGFRIGSTTVFFAKQLS